MFFGFFSKTLNSRELVWKQGALAYGRSSKLIAAGAALSRGRFPGSGRSATGCTLRGCAGRQQPSRGELIVAHVQRVKYRCASYCCVGAGITNRPASERPFYS